MTPEIFAKNYAIVFEGDEFWQTLTVPTGALYDWNPHSTYVQEPPYFQDLPRAAGSDRRRERASALATGGLDHDRPHLPGRLDLAQERRPAGT